MQLVSSLTTPRSVTRCSSALSNKNAQTIRSFSGMVGRTAHQRLLCGHAAVPSLRKAIPRVAGRQRVVTTKAMFERFTEKAIKVVMLAQEEARRLGHNFVRNRFAFPRTRIVPHQCFRSLVSQVGTEQILLGLIGESTGTLGGFSEGC